MILRDSVLSNMPSQLKPGQRTLTPTGVAAEAVQPKMTKGSTPKALTQVETTKILGTAKLYMRRCKSGPARTHRW